MTPFEPTATTQKAAAGDPRRPAVEIPTLLLILATYGAWCALTLAYGRWPLYVLAPLIALVLTLHSSIQHEIVHGHPTRWRALNRLFAMVPLTLWLPYERYRHTHHVHHIDARLTDPLDDPESFYWRPEDWARLGPVARRAAAAAADARRAGPHRFLLAHRACSCATSCSRCGTLRSAR